MSHTFYADLAYAPRPPKNPKKWEAFYAASPRIELWKPFHLDNAPSLWSFYERSNRGAPWKELLLEYVDLIRDHPWGAKEHRKRIGALWSLAEKNNDRVVIVME